MKEFLISAYRQAGKTNKKILQTQSNKLFLCGELCYNKEAKILKVINKITCFKFI